MLEFYSWNLSWVIRLVVWRKVLFLLWECSLFCMCDVNYSVLLLRISFRIYTCPGVCTCH